MKSRGFSLLGHPRGLATLTLAIGLGAAAIGFTVLDSVLLRPLPFPRSEALYSLHHTAPGLNLPRLGQTDATYWLYRESPTLEGMGIYRTAEVEVSGQVPERLTAALVSPEMLPMLGAEPMHGRLFVAEEERPEGIDAALISASYWRRRLGGDSEVLGRILEVDGRPRAVVGVLPASFFFPSSEVDLWLPLALDPQAAVGARFRFAGVVRLPTVDGVDAALGDLGSRLTRLPVDYPQSRWTEAMLESSALAPVLRPLKEELVGGVDQWIWAQALALGLLLLAGCSNVVTLLLVYAEDRRPEVALRVALGADRRQLLNAHLAPALTIGVVAGTLGFSLAALGLHLLSTHGPDVLNASRRLVADGRTLAFTLGIALTLSIALGLGTGLRRPKNPAQWLRTGATAPSHQRWRKVLVIFQIAVATALSAAAGTLIVSQFKLNRVDPGFELSQATSFDLHLPRARYADATALTSFYARTLDRLRSLPGVEAVGGIHRLPLAGGGSNNGWSAEDVPREPDQVPAVFATRWTSEGYFAAMEIPLLRGRLLERADRESMQPVAIVSRSFAYHFWGDEDPLGRRIAPGTGEGGPWYTVVGMVGDVRERGLNQPLEAMVYLPLLTRLPRREAPYTPSQLSLVLRGGFTDGKLDSAIRKIVADLDPELPISNLGPIERLAREDLASSRFALGTVLATVAITGLLGVVGLFGLMTYWVRKRRRDFGVRLALGAHPNRLLRQVHAKSLTLTATGIALGLILASLTGETLEDLIFGVSAVEPWIYLAVAVFLVLTSLVATFGPARQAATTDPQKALRQD